MNQRNRSNVKRIEIQEGSLVSIATLLVAGGAYYNAPESNEYTRELEQKYLHKESIRSKTNYQGDCSKSDNCSQEVLEH